MIRDDVIFWVSAVLLVLFAFVLMPANEYFKDAQGREVDVDPNAPPKPEWLKPINERTGKRESFWGSFFSPTRERMTGGTPTLGDVENAGRAFYKTLAANESDPSLKAAFPEYLGTITVGRNGERLPPSAPIQGDRLMEVQYKLFTSPYTSLSEIAEAAHTNKPRDPSDIGSFLTTAGFTIVGNMSQTPPLSGVTAQQSDTLPQFNTDSTLGSMTGTTGMERTQTRGDLMETQVRFIQTLIGNEPDQATKRALSEGLASLREIVRGTPTSAFNIPIGSTDKAVLAGLTNIPPSYTYRQFAYAYQLAGGVNASSRNIVNMVQSIPSGFNAAATPRPVLSTVSQMSQMEDLTPPDLYGPGPNVLRSALQSCLCGGSQTSSCPIHA